MKAWWADPLDVGSCSSCSQTRDPVLVVRFGSYEVRLCHSCAWELSVQIRRQTAGTA